MLATEMAQATRAMTRDKERETSPPAPLSTGPEPLRYAPLDRARPQIRLFALFPGKRHKPLRGSLTTVDLDTKPKFDAISYVWGDPTPRFDVLIDGKLLRIGQNLRNALVAVRHRRKRRILWTDAVCINQGDEIERGHQVDLMKRVYSTAWLVRVWLDVEVDLKSPAFQAARRLGAESSENVKFGGKCLPPSVNLTDYDMTFWRPFLDILHCPYWGRVWTQQELYLARDLLFHFPAGTLQPEPLVRFDFEIHRELFVSSNPFWKILTLIDHDDLGPRLFLTLHYGFQAMKDRHMVCDKDSASTLLKLFLGTRDLQSSDSRDRVFGMVGLTGDSKITIRADYTLDLLEVYVLVIRQYVQNYRSLDFLCYNGTRPKGMSQEEFPTWLPTPEKGASLVRANYHKGACQAWDITLNYEQLFRYHKETISVCGMHYDSLDATYYLDEEHHVSRIREELEVLHGRTNSQAEIWSNLDFIEILCVNMTGTYYSDGFPDEAKVARQELSQHIRRFFEVLDQRGLSELTFKDIMVKGHHEGWDPYESFMVEVFSVVFVNNVFVATEQKRLATVSLCCSDRKPGAGDEVWILFGCSMPMILRPQTIGLDTKYNVIGPAYMPGLMQGEACRGLEPDGSPKEGYDGPMPTWIDLI